ncbi:MAG: L,D-transpeptidase family protein [Proteobacteria bacterium]|nr:L,D-transpeptidase family protein [Pseudomonadota bacterium]
MKRLATIIAATCIVATSPSFAEIYELPPDGYDVVGAVATITARYEDTLVDIARRHGVGYQDIVRANPDVDVWLPGEGTEIVLPTRFVLPPGPRHGIVLNLAEYRLYYFPQTPPGEAATVMTYPISIGRMDWETPLGVTTVIAKARNPAWYPPQSVRDEHAADGRPLPRVVPPGPDNPLGRFAMRLALPGYLIHGTNRPVGVGMRVTHGCIRMFPEDIEYLIQRVPIDTPVRIVNEPVKIGWFGDELVMEVHPLLETALPPVTAAVPDDELSGDAAAIAATTDAEDVIPAVAKNPLTYVTEQFIAATNTRAGRLDWLKVEAMVARSDGIPSTVGQRIKNAATSAAPE